MREAKLPQNSVMNGLPVQELLISCGQNMPDRYNIWGREDSPEGKYFEEGNR